jgi:hypothetical protein
MFRITSLRKLKFLNILASRLYSFMPFLLVVTLFFLLGFDLASATCNPGDPNCPTLWNVQGSMSGTTWLSIKIIYLVSAVLGLSLIAASLVTLKGAGEGGQQQGGSQAKKGIVLFILGGAMVSLPFMSRVSQNSALQSGITTGIGGNSAFVVPGEGDAYSGSKPKASDFWASNNPDGN